MKRREEQVHEHLCRYIRIKYPSIIFFSDGSGLRLGKKSATMQAKLRSSKGIPDLFLAHPMKGKAGLFIEIKKEDARVWLKNGKLTKNKHIRQQDGMLRILRLRGYVAEFGIGLDSCRRIVDNYMS